MVDDTVEPGFVDAVVLGEPSSGSKLLLGQDGERLVMYPTCGLDAHPERQAQDGLSWWRSLVGGQLEML